ncbi:MAG: VOC family protein [Thermodesulfobacteriota bacterium]
MEISEIDHLVLTVRDIEETCLFYSKILAMKVVVSANNRVSLSFGTHKINLHKKGAEFSPKAHAPTPGSADLCFLTTTSLAEVISFLKENGVQIIEGPVQRLGAQGSLLSIYFRDPDQNLLELSKPL